MARALIVLLLLVAACSDPHAEARDAALAEARDALGKDPAKAVRAAKSALAEHGADPRLLLVAGLAHLRLEQRSEALAEADAGLAFEELPEDLRADLAWVRGAALMSRYRELSSLDDWRAANGDLEAATEAGAHRAEAAAALVFLQDLAPLGTTDRQLRFARLLLELEPDGASAARVRQVLDAKGLTP